MRGLIDPEVMRACEAAYFRASGVASIDVMEVAARALADAALERFPEARRVFVACGPGGNGGDGYACARLLWEAGLDVRIFPAAPAKSADAIANAARVRELIRDAGAEGSRTPVGTYPPSTAKPAEHRPADNPSGAEGEKRIPRDMPPKAQAAGTCSQFAGKDFRTLGACGQIACAEVPSANLWASECRPVDNPPGEDGKGYIPQDMPPEAQAIGACAQTTGKDFRTISACGQTAGKDSRIIDACGQISCTAGMGGEMDSLRASGDAGAVPKCPSARSTPGSLRASGDWGEIPDLWIDCLYGTGLSRAPSGAAAELILRMNRDRAAGAKVLAADIPSGLNGATGARFEPCVGADCTVAFQFAKPGHLLGDGLDACGELRVADVGFPESAFPANLPAQIEPSDLRGMFAPRQRNIHKGSCGHLLIVAGSLGMAGAAVLCARAALRSGVGLVSVACPEGIVPILQALAPCAMCVPLPERDGAISPEAVEPLRAALRGKSAAVIGPGLSRRAAPEVVAAILESGLPAVIDADALNLLAENPGLRTLLRPHHVLTPHPGEAARLLSHPCANPIADAKELGAPGERKDECSVNRIGVESEAASGRAKALACMQEKSAEALNRHAEIPANAQAEALGERAEALASAQGEALGACGEMLADGRKNPERAQARRHRHSAEILADGRKNPEPDRNLRAQNRAEILADGRKNPTNAREESGTAVRAPSGPTAVLKGASRVIAGGGEVYVSASGCPGMARGGSGDVYAGILGALLAEKSSRTPAQSAAAACELHGLAGELAQAKYGPRSMNSADLIEFLPEVFKAYVD